MQKKSKCFRQGIVALFPAIIISSVLIMLCVGVSTSFLAFLYRTTIFDEKVQSDLNAHACVFRVLSKRVQDNSYAGEETVNIGGVSCIVGVFSTTTGYVSVQIGDAVSVENVGH